MHTVKKRRGRQSAFIRFTGENPLSKASFLEVQMHSSVHRHKTPMAPYGMLVAEDMEVLAK